jgi:hypothetical protein
LADFYREALLIALSLDEIDASLAFSLIWEMSPFAEFSLLAISFDGASYLTN